MSTRSEELQRKGRWIFWYSMVAAAAIHVVVFVASPDFEAKRLPDSRVDRLDQDGDGARGTQFIDVFFGPPEILGEGGTMRREPPERVLEARAVDFSGLDLSLECRGRILSSMVPTAGRVRMIVNAGGSVTEEKITGGTGDRCRDEMLQAIAEKIIYEWLPNETFPSPVDLVQPMRVVASIR